jgi:hypothetical protein
MTLRAPGRHLQLLHAWHFLPLHAYILRLYTPCLAYNHAHREVLGIAQQSICGNTI